MQQRLLLLVISFTLFACNPSKKTVTTLKDDGIIEMVFLQLNDVYEISPLEGGQKGGMARVANLRKKTKQKNINTLTVLAGDFLNPSIYGELKYEGSKIKGRQMVEVMNAIPVDLVTFGNHEFDLKQAELQQRMNESNFTWLSTNCFVAKDGRPDKTFSATRADGSVSSSPETYIWSIQDADGTTARIGIFGATLNSNPKDYVYYSEPFKTAAGAIESLEKEAKVDILVGLTHQNVEDDIKLAEQHKNIALIMGGHEHDHRFHQVGDVVVAKADANAKTVYIHTLRHDKKTKKTTVTSNLIPITPELGADPAVESIVKKWEAILNEKVKAVADPYKIIYTATTPLDGLETSIRNKQTNLGQIIAKSMLKMSKHNASGAFFNGGSVRIDDRLEGPITALDIFRVLPFGGKVVEIKIKGELLKKVLDTGLENAGIGGYLQWANIKPPSNGKAWLIDSTPLDPQKTYWIVTSGFMLTGLETNFGFFTAETDGILEINRPVDGNASDARNDIRGVVIQYLESLD